MLLLPKYSAAIPLGGFIVTGWIARVVWIGLVGFILYAAWGLYRLSHRVWLVYTCVVIVGVLSTTVTFMRIDLLDYYRAVGLPEWQIKQLALSPLLKGHFFLWMSSLSSLLLVGYLLYLRRYFTGAKTSAVSPS